MLAIDLPQNVGKAEAVRQGMLRAQAGSHSSYIGYWDADLATPLEAVHAMCRLAAGKPECRWCSARHQAAGGIIDRKAKRHYLGRVFATLASLVLRLPIYDTQCGAKLMQAALVPQLFDQPFLGRWIFDVELLARLRNLVGVQKLLDATIEAPLDKWEDIGGSKLRFSYMMRAPWSCGRSPGAKSIAGRLRRHWSGSFLRRPC